MFVASGRRHDVRMHIPSCYRPAVVEQTPAHVSIEAACLGVRPAPVCPSDRFFEYTNICVHQHVHAALGTFFVCDGARKSI